MKETPLLDEYNQFQFLVERKEKLEHETRRAAARSDDYHQKLPLQYTELAMTAHSATFGQTVQIIEDVDRLKLLYS